MPPTLKDVAKEANVAVSTVSYVLSGSGLHKVGSDTCQRILEVANRLHYRPNIQARNLCKGRSFIAGALIRQLTVSFVPEIIEGLEQTLEKAGYCLILATYSSNEEFTRKCNYLYQHGVEGVAVVPLFNDVTNPDAGDLAAAKIPMVSIGMEFGNCPTVMVKKTSIGREAFAYLASLGHRNIAYAGNYEERIQGMQSVLAQYPGAHFAFNPAPPSKQEDGSGILKFYLQLSPRPTAVVVDSDIDAIAFMHSAGEAGIRIPEDLSVVGVDGIKMGCYTHPPLTSVGQPTYEQGQRAGELLLRAIQEGSIENSTLWPFIIERESCRKI